MRLVLRTSIFLVVACVLTAVAAGLRVEIATPMSVVVACIPFLVAYPIAISTVMHGMSRKVAQQNRWLTRISTTDELTGLANRRQGISAAEQALARHRRHGGRPCWSCSMSTASSTSMIDMAIRRAMRSSGGWPPRCVMLPRHGHAGPLRR